MESKILETYEKNPLNESEEMRKKAREELNRQLQGLLNNQPVENPTEENIEEEVNRLMEEVDEYEKNYVPKDLNGHEISELKNFEEEFGSEEIEDMDEDDFNENEIKDIKEKNIIKNNIIFKEKNITEKSKRNKNKTFSKKKSNFEMDLDLEDLEDIIKQDYKSKDPNNKKEGAIIKDKEIKDLLDEYDKELDKELEKEVEKEFKPKIDIKDVKRADLLLKIDPLINEALVQGRIKKDELVLFIDYYEIFSLSNKAKKFTSQQLEKIDELCYKKNNQKIIEVDAETNKKREKYDLNDEKAIDKLTNEIEKGLQDSEEILMKKLDYEKYKMELNKRKKDGKKNENMEDNDNLNKNKNIYASSKTIKTNYTLNNKEIDNIINKNEENNRPISAQSEVSNFTQEELMSVPVYPLPGSLKDKFKTISKEKNNFNSSYDKSNKTIYKNNQNTKLKESINIANAKPKTPLIATNKNQSKRNSTSTNSINSSLSLPTGKKTIPPIKKSKNNNNLKSKTDQNLDLFDDKANPINMSKYRGARKDLIKLKMGGKSKVHELFINKPRNLEENEKIKQKFIEFIKEGKENNKNPDMKGTKKSIARKKIEEAQNFKHTNK